MIVAHLGGGSTMQYLQTHLADGTPAERFLFRCGCGAAATAQYVDPRMLGMSGGAGAWRGRCGECKTSYIIAEAHWT